MKYVLLWVISACSLLVSNSANAKEEERASYLPCLKEYQDGGAGIGGGSGGGGGCGSARGGKRGSFQSSQPKGGHDKNVRESSRSKHEKADARRQKEQRKAEEKREKNKKR